MPEVQGQHLPPLIIWPASTHRNFWTTHPTPEWHNAHYTTVYTDSAISLTGDSMSSTHSTKDCVDKRPRVLINDGFGTNESVEILKSCHVDSIILCRLPSHAPAL